jgi:hypothetical protein
MAPSAWEDFRLVAFGEPYMVWHDGPDFSALRDQWRTDPGLVERMLLEGLATSDDLAGQAIGELRDIAGDAAPRFEAALRGRLPVSNGSRRVRIAESLRAYTGSDEWDGHIAQSLVEPNFWSERIVAAMALARAKPTPELIAALEQGAQDDEYLVRYHSANSLLAFAGASGGIADRRDLFGELAADGSPGRWAEAASRLAEEARAALDR